MDLLRWRNQNNYQSLEDNDDFLLVVWDACRYDAYLQAKTPVLDAHEKPQRAWAMGTYTLPAHIAMFQGFLPHVFEPLPLYNRFRQQLWRISHRSVHIKPLVTFPGRTRNIMQGFRKRGYFTVGVAAMEWFCDTPALHDGFEFFRHTGTDARCQNQILQEQIARRAAKRPFFAFMNCGETHSPYRHADMKPDSKTDERYDIRRIFNQRGLMENDWQFDHESYARQVACAEFLDARMGEMLSFIEKRGRPTTVVVCADHGECFGENGMHTHAFYHEKVMEVPLLIFRVNAPPHCAPETMPGFEKAPPQPGAQTETTPQSSTRLPPAAANFFHSEQGGLP